MKKIIITLAIAVSVILVAFIFSLFRNSEADPAVPIQPVDQFPIVGGGSNTSDTVGLGTSDGGTISVSNFITDADVVADPVNSGHYYLGNHFPLDGSTPEHMPPYVIDYIASSRHFNIGLFSEPIRDARRAAEVYLMQKLDIPQEQMCELQYTVSVPGFVNEAYSSIDLRFSFCPGSTPL